MRSCELVEVSVRLSVALHAKLFELSRQTSRTLPEQVRYCLAVMLSVSQQQPRFRIFKETVDSSPSEKEPRRFYLSVEEDNTLFHLQGKYGFKRSGMVRVLLWAACDFHDRLAPDMCLLQKEDFVEIITRDLQYEYSKIH